MGLGAGTTMFILSINSVFHDECYHHRPQSYGYSEAEAVLSRRERPSCKVHIRSVLLHDASIQVIPEAWRMCQIGRDVPRTWSWRWNSGMNDCGNRSQEVCDLRHRDAAFEMAGDDRSGFELPEVA